MNKENTTLVISHYNSKEFLNIVDLFKNNSNIIVYNKSDHELHDTRFTTINIPNIGRETYTYLYHIIHNYEKLTDYTIFIQDDTHNHIPNYVKFYNDCNNMITNNNHFLIYPCSWRKGMSSHRRRIVNGICNLHTLPSSNCIKLYCEELNIKLPNDYITNLCAFLICSKKSILDNTKLLYENIMEFVIKHDFFEEGIKPVHAFEHIWEPLFNKVKYFSK